jgi:hypothetical protein
MSIHGTGLTLALLPHWRGERTFAPSSATTQFDALRTFDIIKASGRHRMGRGVRLSAGSLVYTPAPRLNGGLRPADPPTLNGGIRSCKSGDGPEVGAPPLQTDPASHDLPDPVGGSACTARSAGRGSAGPWWGATSGAGRPDHPEPLPKERPMRTLHEIRSGRPARTQGCLCRRTTRMVMRIGIIRRIVPGCDDAPMAKPFSRSLARKRRQARDRPHARRAGSALSRP